MPGETAQGLPVRFLETVAKPTCDSDVRRSEDRNPCRAVQTETGNPANRLVAYAIALQPDQWFINRFSKSHPINHWSSQGSIGYRGQKPG